MTDRTRLDADELAAYFALKEAASLIDLGVEKQLRDDGGITGPAFSILARLSASATGRMRMTDLADGMVYSRSGLTYQAGQLEKAGLVTRTPAEDDERSVVVEMTPAGRELLGKVMPGHIGVVRELMVDVLSREDLAALTDILGRVRDRMRAGPPRSAAPRAGKRT